MIGCSYGEIHIEEVGADLSRGASCAAGRGRSPLLNMSSACDSADLLYLAGLIPRSIRPIALAIKILQVSFQLTADFRRMRFCPSPGDCQKYRYHSHSRQGIKGVFADVERTGV